MGNTACQRAERGLAAADTDLRALEATPVSDDPIVSALSLATLTKELEDLVRSQQCGPILVRLAWHDAGVFSNGKLSGGCPNAVMRFTDKGEGTFGANAGLPTTALSLLAPITRKYCPNFLSHADLWAFASNIAIAVMGGPLIATRFGRIDAKSSDESVEGQEGRLPDGDKGVDHLRFIFRPKGFGDRAIVALSGAHSVGGCKPHRSGFNGTWTQDRHKFDNSYFKNMLTMEYTKEITEKGCPQYRHAESNTIMLESDLALLKDEQFKKCVEVYAENEQLFFQDFTQAWTKLQENGCGNLVDATLYQLTKDLEDLITKKNCGPILIRLSWHDAGVFSSGSLTGGCPNAAMRFKEAGEGAFGANAGLPTVAIALLAPITRKYVPALISHADLWALAANVAIKVMGGPIIPTRFGRQDAKAASESVESQVGRLPDGDKGVDHLREIFCPKGFDDKAIVALSGAHTVGKCSLDRSGFDGRWTEQPLVFDNAYFKNLLNLEYSHETTQKGNPQFYNAATGTIMLASDFALLTEKLKPFVELYASDQESFFKDFAEAWQTLQELGCTGLRDKL
mmetsp:Transcript_98074/g.169981  ORF Transcript_98074/g.169981 Transcript_98074/m.169981 type:complete len:568 (-) Transcript_98074:298-2001(-)